MSAEILRMDAVSRPARHDWEAEASLSGFAKACAVLDALSGLREAEQRTAIENWSASEVGKLTEEEKKVLHQYFGWERGT